ncbi:MAG: beta-ketoacyl-ACP synthase II [Anaerolineae bacterium]
MTPRRVVVTGLGAITPLAHDAPGTWQAMLDGQSGLGWFTQFDPDDFGLEARAAGEVKDFDAAAVLGPKAARRTDRVAQFAFVAAREALADAGLLADGGDDGSGALDTRQVPATRAGTYIGTGLGGILTFVAEEAKLRDKGARRVSAFLLPMVLADAVPGSVAIELGLRGPNMAHLSACASGANAIGEAREAIVRGVADVMLAGGAEAALTPTVIAGFQNMGALSKWQGDPRLASRPFDLERDGFVAGEGAGVLVLEERGHAMARGARIYAELAGYGTTADAVHVTAPAEDGEGILEAMRVALDEAEATPGDLDYINAHGTSTQLNDVVETRAVHRLLGGRAHDVPLSSCKSMIGHLLGAGGAVEAVVTSRVVETGEIPPTINLHTPDPECDLDYVPHVARRPSGGVQLAMSNSLGFGGHNVALVFRAA